MTAAIRFSTTDEYHDAVVRNARIAAHNDSIECPYCKSDQLVTRGNWARHMAIHHQERAEYLSYDEARTLAAHESVIQAGVSMFRAAGKALQEINAKRLYRTHYATFADYCYERWQISRAYAYRLISASEVAENLALSPIGDTGEVLINEAQARELAPLDPQVQRDVWTVVQGTAPKGKVTAQHIRTVKKVLKEVIDTNAIDPGTGEQVAAVLPVLKAAMTEETYERMKRQEQHVHDGGKKKAERIAAKVESLTTTPTYIFDTERTSDGLFYVTVRYGKFATKAEADAALMKLQKCIEKDCK